MTNSRPLRSRITATGIASVATAVVGLCAGVLAARTTHDVALRTGAVRGEFLAWLLPGCIEGAALAAALLRWARGRSREWVTCWPETAALTAIMALSVWVNASHVSHPTPLAVVLAAAPPVVLVGSLELLLRRRVVDAVSTASEHPTQSAEIPLASVQTSTATALTTDPVIERLSVALSDQTTVSDRSSAGMSERPRPRKRAAAPAASGRATQAEQIEKVEALAERLGAAPTPAQIVAEYGVSGPSSRRWRATYDAALKQDGSAA